MEILTKIGAVIKIKSCIFFFDFEERKNKNMEPSEIQFLKAPCSNLFATFDFFNGAKHENQYCLERLKLHYGKQQNIFFNNKT